MNDQKNIQKAFSIIRGMRGANEYYNKIPLQIYQKGQN